MEPITLSGAAGASTEMIARGAVKQKWALGQIDTLENTRPKSLATLN